MKAKKVLSLLLAVSMLFSMLVTTAFAAEITQDFSASVVVEKDS